MSYAQSNRVIDQALAEAEEVYEDYFAGLDYAQQTVEFADELRLGTLQAVKDGFDRGAIFFASKRALAQYGELES